ncbi:MAG: ADP-ribosylglycohydrolase family protein [Bacillota bacterium]
MDELLKGALVANAASLGLNWIYNMPYLEKLSQKEDLVFQKPDPGKYKRAGKAFYAYPEAEAGDVSVQGEIAKWLLASLKENPGFTPEDYTALLLDKFKPGGGYTGWVESYGKKLVLNNLNEQLKTGAKALGINDDQLVGFVPYLVMKTIGQSNKRAWAFASTLTDIKDYRAFYTAFDTVFENLKGMPIKKALKASIENAPEDYQEALEKAFEYEDTKAFIKAYAGTACSIGHAIPLIYHILAHTDSFEEAVRMNTKIGGASSDRGMLIGAFMAKASVIPEDWERMTHFN